MFVSSFLLGVKRHCPELINQEIEICTFQNYHHKSNYHLLRYCIIIDISHIVHVMPLTHLFYNCEFVCLNPSHLFLSSFHHLSPLAILFSISMTLLCLGIFLHFFIFQVPHISEIIQLLVFFCLAYFTQHNTLQVHLCCHKWQYFILFIAE